MELMRWIPTPISQIQKGDAEGLKRVLGAWCPAPLQYTLQGAGAFLGQARLGLRSEGWVELVREEGGEGRPSGWKGQREERQGRERACYLDSGMEGAIK